MSNDEEEVITHMKSYSLTSGSIPRHMLRLAVPLMLGNILQQLYNTVDAFILGRFAGDAEFAAVGVAGSVMNLFLFMITGACTGISVIFAQLYGAEDWAAFRREHWLSLAVTVTVNLVLDYYFVARLHWGISGAAWATAASQMIAVTVCMLYLRRKAPELIFRREDCRMDLPLLSKTAHFSFITGLHQSSLYIGKLLVQGVVNTGGTAMISAYTATTRIEGFANSFGDSGSAATSVLVAQNHGAGEEERVQQSFRSSLILMLLLSCVMYVSASASVRFMLGTGSGTAFESARDYMKMIALFYTLCFTGNTFAGYFEGIGRVSIPFIGTTSHIALRVILSWLLVQKMGLPAVALATGIGWALVNILWAMMKHNAARKTRKNT